MRKSKSSILLMEMIICIFFFALCAVISSQVFVQAHLLSEKTISVNHATIVLGNLSESFYAGNGDITSIANDFPGYAVTDSTHVTIYMDKNYNYIPVSSIAVENYAFYAQLTVSPNASNGTIDADASFYSIKSDIDNNPVNETIYTIKLITNDPITINQ